MQKKIRWSFCFYFVTLFINGVGVDVDVEVFIVGVVDVDDAVFSGRGSIVFCFTSTQQHSFTSLII